MSSIAQVLVGVSNGAVPAAALATKFETAALWLASGCADPSTLVSPLRCPVVLTVADGETFWGGPQGVVAAAAHLHPTVFHFQGWHAWETWDACEQALVCMKAWLS